MEQLMLDFSKMLKEKFDSYDLRIADLEKKCDDLNQIIKIMRGK